MKEQMLREKERMPDKKHMWKAPDWW